MISVKNTVKKAVKYIFVCALSVLFLAESKSASEGAASAIRLCAETVVPSLLPFMVLSGYMVKSGMMSSAGRRFDSICRKIFRLPGEASCIILMSIIGGYPVGAKMTASAAENGIINENQGKRMMLFCVNAGPAFMVNIVGASVLGSEKAGVIMLASTVISAMIMGFIGRFFESGAEIPKIGRLPRNKNDALTASVEDAVKTVILVCGWIIVFGALRQIAGDLSPSREIRLWIDMLCEVTAGCRTSAKNFSLPVTAFVLGFSGFAVHAQILPFLDAVKLKYRFFFASRALNGALSAVTAGTLFKLFPCDIQVFSSNAQITPAAPSVSVWGSAAAIITASLIILDLAPRQKV